MQNGDIVIELSQIKVASQWLRQFVLFDKVANVELKQKLNLNYKRIYSSYLGPSISSVIVNLGLSNLDRTRWLLEYVPNISVQSSSFWWARANVFGQCVSLVHIGARYVDHQIVKEFTETSIFGKLILKTVGSHPFTGFSRLGASGSEKISVYRAPSSTGHDILVGRFLT